MQESGIKREEIFVTIKIWSEHYGYENAKQSVEDSLNKLKTDYLDLVLLHQPFSDYYGAYHALIDLQKEGKARAIGVSDFYPDRLSDIAAFGGKVPQVNQIEINPFCIQKSAVANMKKENVLPEAWGPFREGRDDIFAGPCMESPKRIKEASHRTSCDDCSREAALPTASPGKSRG